MSPSDRIELTLDNIRAIARQQMARAEDDATRQRSAMRSLDLPAGAFGGVPEAQAFGSQHRAVQQVFSDVVAQVVVDVQEFRENLLASVKAHESTDDAVRASLMALGSRYSGHQLHSDTAYDQGVQEHAESLPEAAADRGASDDAGSAQSPAQGPDGTPAGGGAAESPRDESAGF